MPKSVTRWEIAAQKEIDPAIQEALTPYIVDQLVEAKGDVIFGPTETIPEGQYECYRTWNTQELAQNWVDIVDDLAASAGFKSTYKAVIE